MPLATSVAGRYSATYDPPGATAAADVGIMEEGYEVQCRVAKELIRETDAFGEMVVDAVYRGVTDVHIQALALEWKAGLLNALLPYRAMAPSGATDLGPGTIARFDVNDVAGILIFTSTAGTPAATSPATMTATYSCLAENFDVRWAFNSKLRKMPIRWRIYPYDSGGGVIKYMTMT